MIDISKLDSADKENWKDCVKELADKIYSIRDSNKALNEQFAEVEEIVQEGVSRQSQYCRSRGRLLTEGAPAKLSWMLKQPPKVQPLFTSRSKNAKLNPAECGFFVQPPKTGLLPDKCTTKPSNRYLPDHHRRNKSFVQSIGEFYHKAEEPNYDRATQPIKVEKLPNRNSSIEKEFGSLHRKNPVLAQLVYKSKGASFYPFMRRK